MARGRTRLASVPTRIPHPTAHRLSLYLRELQSLRSAGRATVNSREIADAVGVSSAVVRKDLALAIGGGRSATPRIGHAGVGYDCETLAGRIRSIVGKDHAWRAVLVGCGHIGRALLGYGGFAENGFEIVGVFDRQPSVVGKVAGRLKVQPMADLRRTIRTTGAEIGIIAVPREAAQAVATDLAAAGVRGILNFAPMRLALVEDVPVANIDVSVALDQLALDISSQAGSSGRRGKAGEK